MSTGSGEVNEISIDRKFDIIRQAATDSFKLLFELMKHLTTLSAGSLVLLMNVQPKLNTAAQILLSGGFLSLIFSMGGALASMFMVICVLSVMVPNTPNDTDSQKFDPNKKLVPSTFWVMVISACAFSLGISLITCAVILNP